MHQILQFFILVPLALFVQVLIFPRKNEKLISVAVITAAAIQAAALVLFIFYWLLHSYPVLDSKHIVFFSTEHIQIFIDFYFDKTTAVFALTGAVLMLLVSVFSRYYLHREQGFKRFFATLSLFFVGYNLVIFAGNFETLFMGWELLGISSFLLIGFYRDRYLPTKNGMKVISLYRLSDICLILTMWMSHQLWHQNITFIQLNDAAMVRDHLAEHHWYAYLIAFLVFVAAAVKSAQFPFTSWLPRAMEGPTTSSAIFYGSLSVHIGVFILIRTYSYWESLFLIRTLIILTGAITAVVATAIARVQSSVKTQIAYSSAAQIGIMFIEVALGWHVLALIHFTGNAFLRTYQLLVSPSVLSYMVHDMFFNFKPAARSKAPGKFMNTLYMLSVKEWNMDGGLKKLFWDPFKWLGTRVEALTRPASAVVLSLVFFAGVYADIFPGNISANVYQVLPWIFALLGLLLILKAFAERGVATTAWLLVLCGQMFISLSIALLHDGFTHGYILIYLSGSVLCGIVGYLCLQRIAKLDGDIGLNRFHGYSYEKPVVSFVFLIAALGVIGMPFTPTFIGIDLVFSHIRKTEVLVIVFTALSFIFMELAVLRIYSRVFLGQHKKAYHPIAFRSS